MALHVDRDGIHCDVGRCRFDMHCEGRGVAAQALCTDTELVDYGTEFSLEFRPFGISTNWLPSGRVAATLDRCTHRSAVPPTPTPTITGGQLLPPASSTQSMTKVLIASTPSAGMAIFNQELFSEPEPLGIISIDRVSASADEIDVDHRHMTATGGVFVFARGRMHHG